MARVMRHAIVLSLLLLAGCGAPAMHANAKGGMIEWLGTDHAQVWDMASAHCARYGKTAKITSVKAVGGGSVLFDCV